MNIGFIGLGTMGKPMAQNLQKAGYSLKVFNRNIEKSREFQGAPDVAVLASPYEVALQSDIIFTMLTDDAAVEEVYLGEQGIAAACQKQFEHNGKRPGIVVDCSTVYPDTSLHIARRLETYGVQMLEAPVAGSEPQAKAGALTFIVGGAKEPFEVCLPLFEVMGKKALHLGPLGSGSQAKLANNAIAAINMAAVAEGLTVVQKAGGDPALFLEVLASGGARSGAAENKGPKMLKRDFSPQFMAQLMHKDLKLAARLAESLQATTPMLAMAKQLFQTVCNSGFEAEDTSAIIKCYEQWSKMKVEGK